jgi:AcrR family transcriptional regulator
MSPKIVDKEQRKLEIALIALELFAEKGFESASISQIAEAAGIGKGTVYEYFESKEELIHASLLAWVDRMSREAEEGIVNVEEPVDRLKAFVRSITDNFVSDERTIKLVIAMFQSLLVSGKELLHHDLIREAFGDFRKVIIDTLLDGVSKGVFRPEIARDAEKIAINLAAYLDGIALHHFISRDFFDLEEQVDSYLEELIDSLRTEARNA